MPAIQGGINYALQNLKTWMKPGPSAGAFCSVRMAINCLPTQRRRRCDCFLELSAELWLGSADDGWLQVTMS